MSRKRERESSIYNTSYKNCVYVGFYQKT